jgi:predicted molibdopterin-dependent oxidoreductase YjgC
MLDSQEMKALFVNGANPADESPDWAASLDNLELLVVTDLLSTETVQKADVVLPALGWAESDGTYTNLERRVQRAPKAVTNPKSRAAPDWMMLTHLAKHMGVEWPFSDARSVTAEISKAVPGYDGLTWEALGDQGRQWDADSAPAESAQRSAEGASAAVPDDADYPLSLVTGTVLYDGGTLFRLTEQMHGMAHGATVTLNPTDAAAFGLDAGSPVTVQSEQGNLELTVAVDAQVQTGTAWIPESLPGAPVGALLNGSYTQRIKVESR